MKRSFQALTFSMAITAMSVCFSPLCSFSTASIVNGSFEIGVLEDAANWSEIEILGLGLAAGTADRVSAMPGTGQYSMFLEVTGDDDFGPTAEIQQQTTAGTVVAGTAYDFSFFSKGTAGAGGTAASYEVAWFNGGGALLGSATGAQNLAFTSGYTQTSITGLIAPITADSALVRIRLETGASQGAFGELYVDDVAFGAATTVPEPSGLLCLALCALAPVMRRRR